MSWWSEAPELKRKSRFYVSIGAGGTLYPVLTVSKPTVTIESKEYRMINHFYKYPGIPKWENITFTFVDAGFWGSADNVFLGGNEKNALKKSTSDTLMEMLLASGYVNPRGVESALPNDGDNKLLPVVSPEKAAMIDRSFGASYNATDGSQLQIIQVNAEGKKTEIWTLYNPMITKISWGELDYGSDDVVQYTLDVAYDWAELSKGGDNVATLIGEKS